MSMYLGCDLIVDGPAAVRAAVIAAVHDVGTYDGESGGDGRGVEWMRFEIREQTLGAMEEAITAAFTATGAHACDVDISLEWHASYRYECGGMRIGGESLDPHPVRWTSPYGGSRGT